MNELIVEEGGRRLDAWLSHALGVTRSEAARMVEQGRVLVDGSSTTKSAKLRAGQRVAVGDEPRVISKGASGAGPSPALVVRFEDEHLAVVAKSAGVVVHPAPGTTSETLVEALTKHMPLAKSAGETRPGVVHRLDKDTSGLLVLAKTDPAHAELVAAMRERKIERIYVALVFGKLDSTVGRIEAPVGRLQRDPARMGVGGERDAVTEFRVVRTSDVASLLEVKLLTGRTHQIRVHMSHIGHPVVGDASYGKRAANFAKSIGLIRPFLHAWKLSFDHPVTGRRIAIEEPLPRDLTSALERAELGPSQ